MICNDKNELEWILNIFTSEYDRNSNLKNIFSYIMLYLNKKQYLFMNSSCPFLSPIDLTNTVTNDFKICLLASFHLTRTTL